jgi:hypothetical protein
MFSRPQTQRDVARTFLQAKGSLLDLVDGDRQSRIP